MRRLPPLNWVRAFEAASRHLSFTRAAEELHVTQAAVSQQVKALERHLGVALFRRVNNRLFLTFAGQAWVPKLRAGLELIESGVEEMRAWQGGGMLRVSSPSSFSIQWLTPRLERFHGRHPTIDIRLTVRRRGGDADTEEVDLAIRNGLGEWADAECVLLLREEVFPVCSPHLARELREPRDLARHELLHVSGYREDWPTWLGAAGAGDLETSHGLHFEQSVTAIHAAINGLGVALGRSALVGGEIAAGRLVAPFDLRLPGEDAYWIACTRRSAQSSIVGAFRDWLLEEAAAPARASAA